MVKLTKFGSCLSLTATNVCPGVIPQIKPEGPQTLQPGESLVLECIAAGDPNARVVWVPPPGSSVAEVEGRGSAILRVSPVTPNEAGIFTCYIYTDLGPQEKTIEIIGTRLIAVILIIIDQLPTPAITGSPFFNPETSPYLSTDFDRRAFSYSSPATWNSIPTFIKIVPPYTASSATSSLTS